MSVALISAGLLGFGHSSHALPGDSEDGDAETASVVPGFENPDGADKNARGYTNPCRNEGFEYHVSKRSGLVRNDAAETAISLDGEEVLTVTTASTPGTSVGFSIEVEDTFVVQSIEWTTACAADETANVGQYEPGTYRRYWITVPTPSAVFPDLIAEISRSLEAPEVFWPNVDREFGWIYVQVDNDIRMSTVETERVSRSVSNLAGSISVWIEATPSTVTFESGDPDDGYVECTYDQVTAPYFLDRQTGCGYTYRHSSAGSGFHDAFTTRTVVNWDIAASHPLTINNPVSWRTDSIQVAEIQAVNGT